MKLASFHTGLHLTLNAVPYRIERILENGECYLERLTDLAIIKRTKSDLSKALTDGELILQGKNIINENSNHTPSDLSSFPEKEQKSIMRKYIYVEEACKQLGKNPTKINLECVVNYVANLIEDKHKPSFHSVYRWWKKWKLAEKNISALADRKSGKRGSKKFKGHIQSEIDTVIEHVFLTRQKNSIQSTYDALCARINEINIFRNNSLPTPSRATFYRVIEKLNKYEVMLAREGKRKADNHFCSSGKGPDPQYILERVEVDHTPLDVIVINEITGLPDGRPNLTVLLDIKSRMPLGFEIGFEPPSELSVMRALRNSILHKGYVEELYPDIKNQWPAYGILKTLVCDNGLEFHAHQLRRMCAELNIELLFCPKQQPQYKGSVERFLGTLNRQVCHRLPGTTFSNIKQRGDYNSEELAKLTLSKLKELVHEWIIDIYSQSTHRSTQRTPSNLWIEGLSLVEPLLPESIDHLNLILTTESKRVLSHKGIELDGLLYNSSELNLLRMRSNENKITRIRFDKESISYIWVFDEINGDYIQVPCTNFEYTEGLTRRQHLDIRKDARARGAGECSKIELLKSKERFRKKIEELGKNKFIRERKKAARDRNEWVDTKQKNTWSSNSLPSNNNSDLQSTVDWDLDDIPEFETSHKKVC
ncbi:Mu transposase C-terminal domain-containing protein [Pleionea sp. CnH1-48]|uniref:Mu transposase C-terminal domain-containing protein n=1 Tax=Pleionea sp. CnH1-48 TaxID=2954494 RepID=UPI0020982CF3|nr:Mu transposase C-terminal domain-containing protein [Pleionea sp. CnH1-48]MCO7226633.1 DDE-type integrase/transposase/recombinase [Pleionea sp. CnH1-48]